MSKGKINIDLSSHFASYHTNLKDALESDKVVRFVMTKDGVKEVRSNEIGVFVVKTDKVPGAEEIQDSFAFTLPSKIPYDIFLRTLSFFRQVCQKFNNSEAAIQIFWDREKKEYFMYCPTQRVNGSRANFDRDPELEAKHLLVMDIHSHKQCA